MRQNTLQKGVVRIIIFKEGGEWFGVALELNIVESGGNPQETMLLLDEAIRGYLKSARKAGLDVSVLNQEPDQEYEMLWRLLEKGKPVPSPYKVYSFGEQILNHAARS